MEKRDNNIDRRSRQVQAGVRGRGPVIYWMDRDKRAADNWALLWAQQEAISRSTALQVIYYYDPTGSTIRHELFNLSGLAELHENLYRYNIDFVLVEADPADLVGTLANHLKAEDAHVLVTDFSPLRTKCRHIEELTKRITVPMYEVDSHNIVPAWVVTDKKEYAAYTIRPKINRLRDDYLTDFPDLKTHPSPPVAQGRPFDVDLLASRASISFGTKSHLPPGERAAQKAMKRALSSLHDYVAYRNDPNRNAQSGMSPYFHFGQLAPQRLAWNVQNSSLPEDVQEMYLEELIVRRELADNFCLFEPLYDRFEGFPEWARKSLDEHRSDKREYHYSFQQFDQAKTHESLWNTCQRDLVITGKLHGYLRMYWAKKILEWAPDPEAALDYTITLNDSYSLDGSDPNGYAGIAWAIGGVHDRAWAERKVFGKIRYMNEAGCRRKFNVDSYLEHVENRQNQWSVP